MLRRLAVSLCLSALVGLASCADKRSRTLGTVELKQCLAAGGYESRSAFGFPICQFRYADAGKTCTGKADCEGWCRLRVDGLPQMALPQPGQSATGVCQAEHYDPGCWATIEDGKVTREGAVCED